MERVVVRVPPGMSHGEVTDVNGRFVLRDVPADRPFVVAQTIGHDIDVAFLHFGAVDSVDVTLTLEETLFPIPGTDVPLPDRARLEHASNLLPDLLRDAQLAALVRTHWPDVERGDTLTVWAPWLGQAAAIVAGEAHVFRVTRACTDCAASTSTTLEGGVWYVAGIRHLRIGLRAAAAGTPRVEFCVGLADPGDTLMPNCMGPARSLRLLYFQRGPDDWVRFDER